MPKLYACLAFYNDGLEMLERCLKSLKPNGIDKIIAIDGCWKGFPLKSNETCHSEETQVQRVKKYADYFVHGTLWESQVEKRNAYLDLVPENDFLFIIDADEQLMNKLDKENIFKGDFWNVRMHRPLKPQWADTRYNRIYKKYSDLKYFKKHCALYYSTFINANCLHSGLISRLKDLPFAPSTTKGEPVLLNHYAEARSRSRKKQRIIYAYAKKRLAKEPAIVKWNFNFPIRTRADYIMEARKRRLISSNKDKK